MPDVRCLMSVQKPSRFQVTKKKLDKNRRNPPKIDQNKRKKNSTSFPLPRRVHNDSGIPKGKKRMRQVDFQMCNNSDVYKRAKELQASLPPEFPSEIRIMMPSHVSGCFWLHIPTAFSNVHLPKEDVIMTLEDENGKTYHAKFLWTNGALSGGWRGFSIAQKLVVGDAVVFQLVKRKKFKVYIVRSNGSLAAGAKLVKPKWESTSDDVVAETFGRTMIPKSVNAFKQVESMENFEIVINKLVGDSKISKLVGAKYYELCCSQQSFLHEYLLQSLNHKLVSGIICETVILADAIIDCEITTSIGIFFIWGQTLKTFEDLGMNVGFLRARLDQLVYLAMKLKMCREDWSIETLDVKPSEAKETDIELESTFQKVKNAPW